MSLKRDIRKMKTKYQRSKRRFLQEATLKCSAMYGICFVSMGYVWDSFISTEIYVELRNLESFLYHLYQYCCFRNWVTAFLVNAFLESLMFKYWCLSPLKINCIINTSFPSLISAFIYQIHRARQNICLKPFLKC